MKKLSLLIVVLLLLAFTVGVATRYAVNARLQGQHPAYTITWQATDYNAEGQGTPYYTETRHVSATGRWHSIRQYADGKTEEMFAEVGNGVFLKRGEKMRFLSEYPAAPKIVDEGELRKSPNYLRTETVAGQLAVVVKAANGPNNDSEFYRAPALGGEVIKTVLHQEGGAKTVIEPVGIVLGEPDEALLRMPKDLPVDHQHFEKMRSNSQQ